MRAKYQLIIKTNQYVGNFQRELCAYVFGAFWDAQEWVSELTNLAHKEIGDLLAEELHYFYDTHGQTCCEIFYDSDTLIIYFDKNPIKHKDVIKQRLTDFPDVLAKSWEFAPKDVKILDVNFYKEEVELIKLDF